MDRSLVCYPYGSWTWDTFYRHALPYDQPRGPQQGIFRDEKDSKRFFAYLAKSIAGCTVKEIADHFRRSSVMLSETIKKVEDLLRKDIAFMKGLRLLPRF